MFLCGRKQYSPELIKPDDVDLKIKHSVKKTLIVNYRWYGGISIFSNELIVIDEE